MRSSTAVAPDLEVGESTRQEELRDSWLPHSLSRQIYDIFPLFRPSGGTKPATWGRVWSGELASTIEVTSLTDAVLVGRLLEWLRRLQANDEWVVPEVVPVEEISSEQLELLALAAVAPESSAYVAVEYDDE